VPGLIDLNQRDQDVQTVSFRGARSGVSHHQGRDLLEGGLVICFSADGRMSMFSSEATQATSTVSASTASYSFMGADELHVDDLQLVSNGHDPVKAMELAYRIARRGGTISAGLATLRCPHIR
jgi:hypothetical protein